MADYGTTKRYIRAKVPMQVLRGFYPTEPNKLSSLAAPLDVTPGTDVAIKSGMPIVKKVGTYRGIAATGFRNAEVVDNVSGVPVYIALHDADAHDVQAAGSLVGLDCSDKFEVQSGYYDAAIVWQLNDPLMVGSDGVFTLATVGKFIVGYITAVGNGTNNTIITGGKTPSATDMKVIQFKTAQNGQVKA
jgi:hypothetical protein